MSTKTAVEWADEIMPDIDSDISDGTIPADVADFGELHDYTDANTYLECMGDFDATDAAVAEMVAVETEISRRLAARAPAARRRIADVVTFDLGWYVAESDETVEDELREVRSIADAYTDPDCEALYLDDGAHSASQIAGWMRDWFGDAEPWLLRAPQPAARGGVAR